MDEASAMAGLSGVALISLAHNRTPLRTNAVLHGRLGPLSILPAGLSGVPQGYSPV